MAHNSRIRTIGTWIGALLPLELTEIGFGLQQALNGDAGGVWAPTAAIEIDGAGLSVTGPTALSAIDTLTMSGGSTLTIGGEVDVSGTMNIPSTGHIICQSGSTTLFEPASTFNVAASGSVTCVSTSTINFQTLLGAPHPCQWAGAASFTSTFGCTISSGGAWTFQQGTTLTTACTVTQQFGNTASINCPVSHGSGATVTRACNLKLVGPYAGVGWRRGTTTNGNSTYDASKDSWTVPAVSAGLTYTIAHSGAGGTVVASTGMRMHFHQRSGGNAPILKTEGGATIYNPGATPWWADLYFDGTWRVENQATGAQGFTNLS